MEELKPGDWYEDGDGDVCEKGVDDEDGWLANVPNGTGDLGDCRVGPWALINQHNAVMKDLRALRDRVDELKRENERLRERQWPEIGCHGSTPCAA